MDGIKVHLARPIKQATPLSIELLEQVADMVDYNIEFEFCAFAAMLTGFYLVLQSSNLVPLSTNKFNPHEQLTRWHIDIDPELELVLVLIEWSKNNQNYGKEMWVPVCPATNPKICLVRVLDRFFRSVLMSEKWPCFSYHNKKGQIKSLTYEQLNEQIKLWVGKTGRQGKQFSTHCLRRGGINFAVKCGISPEYLQVMGDWASQAFLRYIDFALDLRLNLAEQVAKNN